MTQTNNDFENKARPLAEKLIDYAKTNGEAYNITDVRISIYSSAEQENSIENGEVSESVSGTSWNVSVTLFSGGRSLTFQKNTLDEDMLCKAIDQNMKIIHIVPENDDKRLLESEKVYKGATVDLDLYDNNPPTQEELIDYAKKMEAAAFAESGVKTARESSISQTNSHNLMMSTNGLDYQGSRTMYQASISAIAEDDEGMQSDYDYSIARHFSDMAAPEEVGCNAGQNAVAQLNSSLPESKEISIILSQEAAQTFFSSVFSAIDGTEVHREATFLKDKVGQQVMSKGITIEDDPRIAKGISSQYIDSSGMESEKITFIKDGVLEGFNVGLTEARKLGIEPIGRNDGLTNSRVLPGRQSKEDLMSDITDGIYIKGFQGGSADVNSGRFSRQAYGTLIKDGKITDIALSGFAVGGNMKDMFMNVSLANDTPDLPHCRYTMAVPTIRIDGMKIAGK